MIKKILLTLGVLTIGLINYSFAGVCSDHGIGNYSNNFKWQFINGYSNNFNSDYNYGGLPFGNFETLYNNTTKKVIAVNRNTLFWWQENGRPYIYRNNIIQGEPDKIITCNKNTEIGFHGITGCNCVDLSGNVQNIINFMGTIKTGDYIGVAKLGAGFFVCFSSEELNSSMCFGESSENYSDTYLINSKNYSNIDFSNLDENLLFDSPGLLYSGNNNTGEDGLVDLSYKYTNQEVFDAYGEAGYYRSMCFSDFSLNDLTESSGGFFQFEPDLVDGVYYTGSTVIDLYNSYSGSRSFYNFFSHWYNLYKYSLTVNSYNSFVGYSKGLWRIGYKYYMAGLGSSSMNYNNYYNYCNCFARMDLSVYGDDIYNCGSVPLEVENNFNKGNDYGSGVLGNLTGEYLQTPDEFFDNLTNSFNTLLDSDYGTYSGIIPVYILIALMGLIFIRMISH